MQTHTLGELYEKVRADPARAFGARSSLALDAYVIGYTAAVSHHQVATVVDELGGAFRAWADAQIELTPEHESRLNARSMVAEGPIALLWSEDEHTAFETLLAMRAQCARELGPGVAPTPFSLWTVGPSLFELIATVRTRPGVYFGDTRVEYFWAMINGYCDAESDHGVASIEAAKIKAFQQWVDERYPFGRGLPWFRVFRMLGMWPERGADAFLGHFDMFVSSAPPDAPDPGMCQMLEAIVRHAKSLDKR